MKLQIRGTNGSENAVGVLVGLNRDKAEQIQRRLNRFGARTSRVAKALPRTEEGRYISKQIMRSGVAAAANYAEARGAESRADFVHKLRIVLKELNESHSWLEQIVENGLLSRDKLVALIAENQELCWIFGHPSRPLAAPDSQFKIS
jgi:four helix bundle protein